MATVTGLTAERMLDIEGKSIVDGDVIGDNLILTKHNGQTINAGSVRGPQGTPGTNGTNGATGPQGPPGIGSIPGEVRMWASSVLPAAQFGTWVWADGNHYLTASYPVAAQNIGAEWRTFGGASDPGGLRFRVPDLRGLTPVGMDQMPGGGAGRANRMTRAIAIVLAGRSGEETHVVTIAEMPYHAHGGGNHTHAYTNFSNVNAPGGSDILAKDAGGGVATNINSIQNSGQIINGEGGGNGHENVQPTVFIPYIVCLA